MIDGFGRNTPPRMQNLPAAFGTGLLSAGTGIGSSSATAAPTAAKAAAGSRANVAPVQLRDVARSMAAKPPVDAERVAELRAAVISGRYRVDPDAIAARMIAFDRGSGRS